MISCPLSDLNLTRSISGISLSLNGSAVHMVRSPQWHLAPGGLLLPGSLCLHLTSAWGPHPSEAGTLDLVFGGGRTLELNRPVSHLRAATSHLCPQAKHRLSWGQFLISALTTAAPASWNLPGCPFLDPCLATEQWGAQNVLCHDSLQSLGCPAQSRAARSKILK